MGMLKTVIVLISSAIIGDEAAYTNIKKASPAPPLDPEMYMNATQIITANGYPVEDHIVQTNDGFILSLQRIPHGKKPSPVSKGKPVVLLQHGLLASSDVFVIELNQSLAFILADAGYDVWLGNSRGNVYSRTHVRYNTSQDEFWAWSWDEHAKYDLPATVDYVLQATNQKQLYYIGHSQGTLIGFAGFSINQTLQDKIKLFVALAPIGHLSHIRGFLHAIAKPVEDNLEFLYVLFGRRDFQSNSTVAIDIAKDVCIKEKVGEITCASISGLMNGFDPKEKNVTRSPVYMSHASEGTSVQNMIHYAQAVTNGKFQMYDFGSSSENIKHYKQAVPPEYDPTKINIPVAMYHGGNDWLADPSDVSYLLNALPNIVYKKEYPTWDHLDFILALDAPKMLYSDVIKLMADY